jgi:hypothetical protein
MSFRIQPELTSELTIGAMIGVKMSTDSITDIKQPTIRKKSISMMSSIVELVVSWTIPSDRVIPIP